jgi:hypothetical protein
MKGQKLKDLNTAQIMEGNARSVDEIFKETGMFRGSDGRWRYEIDDSTAYINKKWYSHDSVRDTFAEHGIALDHSFGPSGEIKNPRLRKWKTEEKVDPSTLSPELKALFDSIESGKVVRKLPEVLNHPGLYEAYPNLKNFNVVYDPKHKSAHASYHNNEIVLGPHYKDDISTFVHETQHLIQSIEGFAGGGAPMKATKSYQLKYQKAFEEMKPELERMLEKSEDPKYVWTVKDSKRLQELGHIAERYQAYVLEADKQAMEYYMRLAGEVEARNVEIRLLMDKASRKNVHPRDSQDYPIGQEIIMPNHSGTTAYGVVHPETGKLVKPKD